MSYDGEDTLSVDGSVGVGPPTLLGEVRRRLRLKHYSLRTEQAYMGWIRRYIRANAPAHPRSLGGVEVERFLSGLAVEGRVAPSTQNQALSAVLFLYREVLGRPSGLNVPVEAAAEAAVVLAWRNLRPRHFGREL